MVVGGEREERRSCVGYGVYLPKACGAKEFESLIVPGLRAWLFIGYSRCYKPSAASRSELYVPAL